MLTTMLIREVAWETCQWKPVADAVAGILVRSIMKLRTERKKLFWLTAAVPSVTRPCKWMEAKYHNIVHHLHQGCTDPHLHIACHSFARKAVTICVPITAMPVK